MKKVPSNNRRKHRHPEYKWQNKNRKMGVALGSTGAIEGGKDIKNFYRRIIKEHFYLGWRKGKYDKISIRLNELRISPNHVNKTDGKSFILQQETLLLYLTEIITEDEKNNIIAMIESPDEDNLTIAEIILLQKSSERVKRFGRANPNTQRSLENYAYAKKHYYNEIMPNAERIMNTHDFEYYDDWQARYKKY